MMWQTGDVLAIQWSGRWASLAAEPGGDATQSGWVNPYLRRREKVVTSRLSEQSCQTGGWPQRVLLVCSSGGHLAQLHRLRPWWEDRERRWVTFQTADAVSLLRTEDVVWAHHPTTRNVPNLLRNFWLAVREVRAYQPDVIVSDGAGVALPFFLVARFVRIGCIYLEVLDRIDSRTLTGRLCKPLSNLFLVQSPQQQLLYPGSHVVGELL
jgi:hypothetical protein